MDERLPPHNLEAEESVLGSILLDPGSISLIPNLTPDDFWRERNRHTFAAMLELWETGGCGGRNGGIDVVTLTDVLTRKGILDDCGGPAFIMSLMNAVPTASHVQYYADIIAEKAQLRRLIEAGSDLVREAYKPQAESIPVRERALALLNGILPSQGDSATMGFYDSLTHYLGILDQRETEKRAGKPRMTMPWDELRYHIPFLLPGQMMVVAAESSVGKTFFCEECAEAWARDGFRGIFFHFELSHSIMLDRRMARHSGVSIRDLWAGVNNDAVQEATDRISHWPGSIDYVHCPGWTIQRVAAEANKAALKGRAQFVIVDYLQKAELPPAEYGMNKAQMVGRDAETLKTLGERIGAIVVTASQLSRNNEVRKTGKNIRDSGEPEEKANILITLNRPILDLPLQGPGGDIIAGEGERTPYVTVRVDKNTMGTVGESKLLLIGPRFKLVSMTNQANS